MRTETITNLPQPITAPLARDPDGHPIPLPDGAAAWRIRRHTGGRPKLHLDANKEPMVFPLHYTLAADVEEILPPGTYRLDLTDARGELLETTVAISIGSPRNASEGGRDEDDENHAETVSTKLPVTSSDVRLVLEANIKATQLAFQHNERTLATSLRMAETLRAACTCSPSRRRTGSSRSRRRAGSSATLRRRSSSRRRSNRTTQPTMTTMTSRPRRID